MHEEGWKLCVVNTLEAAFTQPVTGVVDKYSSFLTSQGRNSEVCSTQGDRAPAANLSSTGLPTSLLSYQGFLRLLPR